MSTSDFLPLIDNEQAFLSLRAQLLAIAFAQRSYLAHSMKENEANGDSHTINVPEIEKAPARATRTGQDRLILHYTYEQRLESYKRDFHHVWQSIFTNTPVMDTRVIIGHRNSRNLQRELVHKRPHPSLLGTITRTMNVNHSHERNTECSILSLS